MAKKTDADWQAKPAKIKKQKVSRELKHVFLDAEKDELANDLAQKTGELYELEEKKKALTSDLTSQQKLVKAEVQRLATLHRQGFEYRSIDCEQQFDYEADELRVVRLDTYEVVECRQLKDHERQVPLSLATTDE